MQSFISPLISTISLFFGFILTLLPFKCLGCLFVFASQVVLKRVYPIDSDVNPLACRVDDPACALLLMVAAFPLRLFRSLQKANGLFNKVDILANIWPI